MCTELARFFQVSQAGFALLNPQRTTAEVIAEYRAPGRPSALGLLIPVADNPSMAYILKHKTPLAVADAQSDPLLAPVHEIMRQQDIASILLVPILIGGEVAGTLGIDALQRREFSEADMALARNVASQVGQVLERLNLFAIAQEHAERMSRLASLGESLSRLLTLDEVVAVIGQGALSLSDADQVAVYLRNSDNTISCPWARGLSPAYLAQMIAGVKELFGSQTQERVEPMLASDVRALEDGALRRWLSGAQDHQAVALWPLVYEGRTVAAVGCYYDAPHTWSEAEQEAMQTFARQAAVTLENARLYASLQEANERLRATVQARDQMIQNVSHELRTPLALIMGYVELLSEKTLGSLNLEQEYTLSVLHSQSERLHYMVKRLLTLQTLDTRVLEKIPFDVGHLLREMVQAWEAQAAKTGVELRLDISPNLPSIMADYDLLNQVFVNLLDNALKFSPNGGVVAVRVEAVTADHGLLIAGCDEAAGGGQP